MAKTPIMSADQERYMAFEGLIQWTQAVISQCQRVCNARDRQFKIMNDAAAHRHAGFSFHSECHFFVIAAYKLIEYRKWVSECGLFAGIDFSEIDSFQERDIRDLRNMREHVVEYFQGGGHAAVRWVVETPESKGDASSVIGTMIGGRLDWVKFTAAAKRLLPNLLAEPIPYPLH